MEMYMEKLQQDKSRYERKYHVDQNSAWKFRHMLNNKGFKISYPKRKINSIYFDTYNYSFFKDNVEGVKKRIKPRIRWYESVNPSLKYINKLTLEIKKKEGFIGTKEFYNLDLKIKNDEIFKIINDFNFLKKISLIVGKNVFPVIQTSYLREYYLSKNNKFRSTIDTNLNVKNIKTQNNIELPLRKEIMEIKYSIKDDEDFRNTIVNKNFNFRFQKFSKYVTGLLDLKKNGFI
jgi:hypothetical protein